MPLVTPTSSIPATTKMPATTKCRAAFIGHGNPMNALETNRYTQAWRAFGRAVPRPRAILVVSAHWYINATAVTAMPRPRTIHDFYGFPQRAVRRRSTRAPGLPELAEEIADVVHPTWVGADVDSWGIDHGTWSVLVHAFPDADIPVVQLSINADKPLRLPPRARRAAGAAARAAACWSSAAATSSTTSAAIDRRLADAGFDWAQRFDEDAKRADARRPGRGRPARRAPRLPPRPSRRPDHFIPLLYLAGLAERGGRSGADVLVDGYAYGSLSMTAYTLDLACHVGRRRSGAAARAARGRPAGRLQHLTSPPQDEGVSTRY